MWECETDLCHFKFLLQVRNWSGALIDACYSEGAVYILGATNRRLSYSCPCTKSNKNDCTRRTERCNIIYKVLVNSYGFELIFDWRISISPTEIGQLELIKMSSKCAVWLVYKCLSFSNFSLLLRSPTLLKQHKMLKCSST